MVGDGDSAWDFGVTCDSDLDMTRAHERVHVRSAEVMARYV
jgi:hypothetical protein